jgi:predicted RNase H-like HicB family nuclease/predicted RNA binding protein YcfA (HicA-like mRNA interferase family)
VKVRDVIHLIEQDDWFQVAMRGSHRQYKHPNKPGRVTIAGKPSDEMAPRHPEQCAKTGRAEGAEVMRYAIVIEKADDNYSAYVPDLPGCVATGATVADVEAEIRDAIRFHVEGLRADGVSVPTPTSIAEYVDA